MTFRDLVKVLIVQPFVDEYDEQEDGLWVNNIIPMEEEVARKFREMTDSGQWTPEYPSNFNVYARTESIGTSSHKTTFVFSRFLLHGQRTEEEIVTVFYNQGGLMVI